MISLLLIALLIVLNFLVPLPQNVLHCAGVEASGILGSPVDWEMVNSLPDNVVDLTFSVGDVGMVWKLSKGYILVFDRQPEQGEALNAYHPCGVYALGPVDMDLLLVTYQPKSDLDQYNSWQEYWLATHNLTN